MTLGPRTGVAKHWDVRLFKAAQGQQQMTGARLPAPENTHEEQQGP